MTHQLTVLHWILVEFCYLVRDSNHPYVRCELQGFKDASTEAYGVNLYRREETV